MAVPPPRASGAGAEPPLPATLTLSPGCGSPGALPGRCCYCVLGILAGPSLLRVSSMQDACWWPGLRVPGSGAPLCH